MTVSTVVNHEQYEGNGITTVFPYRFRILKSSHMVVTVSDTDGNLSTLQPGTDYDVTGVGLVGGGNVELKSPLATGWQISLDRDLPAVQETDLRNQGKFFAETHEDAFDYLTMLIQRAMSSFSLALRKPSWIAKYYDAQGNQIANLADPQHDQDAATKKYVDDLEGQNISRTLRVPEAINQLPAAAGRANKIPAFDAAGNAIVIVPPSGSASDVMIELAKATGAGKVGALSGLTVQGEIDAIHASLDSRNSFAYIEDFSNLVTAGDWSDAIQAAFNTGKVIVGRSDKTYKVSKIINSQGQAFIGSLSLQLARSSISAATFSVTNAMADKNSFRGIYVQSAYDLCELLRIKSMGFNTLLHYCYFDNNGTIDAAGTIPQLVKNAATAGLNVVVNTQNSAGHGHGSVADVINSVNSYSNVIGYSIIDEPGSAGHSLAEQEAAIATARALTNKKLYSVDFIWRLNTWTKPWSYNYDVFLVDSYSMYYASGTAADKLNKDLGKMRADFGAATKMTGNARVIPCFQAYAHPETSPVEGINGSYSFDVDQIVAASKIFGKVGNGDFACFVWDGGMEINVSNNAKLQNMINEVVNHAGKGERYITDPMIFGGVGSVYQRSLHDITEKLQVKDPGNTVDSWLGGGAWPVRLMTGATETPIRTTTANINISGISFNKSFSRLVTKHNARQYVTAFGVFENYGTALTGAATLNLYTTPDGGYIENVIYSGGVTGGTPFRLSSKTTNTFDGVGEDLVIGLVLSNPADYMDNYRRFLYGLFVSTNW